MRFLLIIAFGAALGYLKAILTLVIIKHVLGWSLAKPLIFLRHVLFVRMRPILKHGLPIDENHLFLLSRFLVNSLSEVTLLELVLHVFNLPTVYIILIH